ncbi:MAG: CAP domain-containing protein [Caldilineaceae bacterium]|nr:CAP domain-containing protein [Caldilineaceae bacterium]
MTTKLINLTFIRLSGTFVIFAILVLWPGGFIHLEASELDNDVPSPETLHGCGGAVFDSSNPAFEQEVIDRINQIRLDNGLAPFKRVASLTDAARFHAVDMSEENYFSHTGHDRINGALVESCKWSDRLKTYYFPWFSASENIAAGYANPAAVVDGWMNSPGHRRNILSPNNWEIGVGFFAGTGSYRTYWVQDFGRQPDVYPVVINNEAATTDDGQLTLYTYGEWDEIRLRVDGHEWSDWQPFASSINWALQETAGTHEISVEMRGEGVTAQSSDSIELTTSTLAPTLNDLPDSLHFIYETGAEALFPARHTIQPLSGPLPPGFHWQVEANVGWLHFTPAQGNGEEDVDISPSMDGVVAVGAAEGTLSVSLWDANGAVIGQQDIVVSLTAVEERSAVFLPVLLGQ